MTLESANPTPGSAANDSTNLTLEPIIYLVFGVFLLILGVLLFKIGTGELPFNQDSTYGILLVITSIYAITTGKTQFGDFNKSWLLVLFAFFAAVVGTLACLIPGFLSGVIQVLTGLLLLVGGIMLFLQLVISKDKARLWITIPGILQHLAIACAIVYLMEILLGFVTLFPNITTAPIIGILCILFGISFFYLAWCVRKAVFAYPRNVTPILRPAEGRHFILRDPSLTPSIILLLMMGIILLIVAFLMIPLAIGILSSYSHDSQYGLLLVIMALQVMILGETPFGVRTHSWLLILVGLVFAGFGMVSCIVPGLLSGVMLGFLGIWNLIAGCFGLVNLYRPIISDIRHPQAEPAPVPPIIKKLLISITLLQLVTILFGINILVPDFIPGLLVLIILFIMAFLIINVAYIQTRLPAPEGVA